MKTLTRSFTKTFVLCGTLAIAFSAQSICHGQLPSLSQSKTEKPTTDFVPKSAFASAAIFPAAIDAQPNFKMFPREIVSAWGKKEFGFDPMLISQATWVMKKPENLEDDPLFAAILHFNEMQGLSGKMIDDLKEKKIAGRTVFSGEENGMPSFMVFDEATIVVGMEGLFEELATANGNGELAKIMAALDVRGQVFAFADVKSVRPLINEILRETDELELPIEVEALKQIPDLVDSIQAGMSTSGKIEANIIFMAASDKAAEKAETIVLDAMEYGKEYLVRQMASQMDLNDPVQVATIEYAKRMAEKYERVFTPDVSGRELKVTLGEEIMGAPFLLSFIRSYGLMMEGPTTRMTTKNQLRQTALAFHNYESAYQKFPSHSIDDEDGRPLFSGRVAMLPFLEQSSLHDNLKMDEPWNSAHNSQFTSMVIPAFGMRPEGNSTIQFPVYPNSLWDLDNPAQGFGDITDGTSNTIFAIDVPIEAARSWADPEPWRISKADPMADIFGDREEVTVAMMDGSVRVLKKSQMTNDKLKAMLTYSGGEIVED